MTHKGTGVPQKIQKRSHRAPRNYTKKSKNALKMAKKGVKKGQKESKMIQKMGLKGVGGSRGRDGGRTLRTYKVITNTQATINVK